jgi:drug/metabolite transporter (DMT)-like permease
VQLRRWTLDNPYFLLLFAGLCWAGNHVIGRAAAGHVPPLGLSVLRWLLPGLVLWPFVRANLRSDWPTIRKNWRILVPLALGGGALFSMLQYVGLQHTTALNSAVLNSLAPVFMVITAAVFFADFLVPRQIAGVAVSLLGVLAVISRGDPQILKHLEFNQGDVLIVINMAVWGVYSACLRLKPAMHGSSFLLVLAFVSTIASLPFAVVEAMSGFVFKFDALTIFTVLYVASFSGFFALASWNRGVELIGSNRAGPFLHTIPFYGAVLSGVFLGERLGVYHVIGFAMILTGVWLAARRV